MDVALLLARLLLTAVFGVAGVAKLLDRPGSRQAIVGFGLPARLAGPLGLALPIVELATAILLLPVVTAWWSAVAALVLLLVFVAGISVALARGQAPDCRCFGQLSARPISRSTLARNGGLALVAAFVVWFGFAGAGASAVAWTGRLSAAEAAGVVFGLLVVVALGAQSWLLLHLLRQHGRLLIRLEALEVGAPAAAQAGLPVGAVAPPFRLPGLQGETVTLESLRAFGKPTLLVFTDPGCGPCNALLPELATWQRNVASKVTIALISRDTTEANRIKSTEHALTHVLLQQDREVADAYQAAGTPGAVVVQPDGTIGSPLALGADEIRGLLARTLEGVPSGPSPLVQGNGNGLAAHGAGRTQAIELSVVPKR